MNQAGGHTFGIVGGLAALPGVEAHCERALAPMLALQDDIIVEQSCCDPGALVDPVARKLHVYDRVRSCQQRGADSILLPCFTSQGFLAELNAELAVPILDLLAAMREHVGQLQPPARRLGVLTADDHSRGGLFEQYFDPGSWTLLYPRPAIQSGALRAALRSGEAGPLLARACQDLADQGAELILPGCTELPFVLDDLSACPVPILDCCQVYARYAVGQGSSTTVKSRKVGVVGGVGPAATVDFLAKLVRNTPARRDQEHLKVVVEQNPQIPDRTAHLVAGGMDPTIALYATCKRLEAAEADLIAIPCNTAHAFVERIQPHLGIPIVNMLVETIRHIQRHPAGQGIVGLLATDGTVKSRVYHEAAARAGVQLVTPDEPFQRKVMEAIYGPQGAKAGCTEGPCREDLLAAMEHLVRDKGAGILILGCTELPLLVAQSDRFPVLGKDVAVLDPTEILARRCVELAQRGLD